MLKLGNNFLFYDIIIKKVIWSGDYEQSLFCAIFSQLAVYENLKRKENSDLCNKLKLN